MDVAPEDAGQLRPRIALNADQQPVVLWSKSGSDGCFVAAAVDGVFQPPMRVDAPADGIAAAYWQGPSIAAQGNTLWAVYKALPEEGAPCFVVPSTDGGLTWGDTLRVDPPDGTVSRFPVVAVSPDGDPIVQYMQFTSGFLEPRQVVRTRMGGMWMPVAPVSAPFAPGEVCDCCTGEVLADEASVVSIYRNAAENIRVMWGASSTDGGMSFNAGGQLDSTNWLLPACPSSGPDGYLIADSVRYVWMSGASNGNKVFLGSAATSTMVPAAQVKVHGGQPEDLQQNFPRIAGSGDTLGIVWEQFNNGAREILFSWSTSGVMGLSEPDTVNMTLTGQQRTPDIAYANGSFHIVWSELSDGLVRYRRAAISTGTAIANDAGSRLEQLVYDAVTNRIRVSTNAPGILWIRDPTGRIVHMDRVADGAVDLPALSQGPYIATMVGKAGTACTLTFVIH